MIREYMILQVILLSNELVGQYEPTAQGELEALRHIARLNDKYGENSAVLQRNPCSLYELSQNLELEYHELPKERYLRSY